MPENKTPKNKSKSFIEGLKKIIPVKNYKGLLVEYLGNGKVVWNKKEFENIEKLDEYLKAIKFNVA